MSIHYSGVEENLPTRLEAPTVERVATLSNGLRVVTSDNHSPLSSIALSIGSGFRDETANNLGVVHVWKNVLMCENRSRSSFALGRDLSNIGAALSTTADREAVTIRQQCLRDHVPLVTQILADMTIGNSYDEWDLEDVVSKLTESPSGPDLMDLVHKAAFGATGLGNPTAVLADRVKLVTPEMVRAFAQSALVPKNMVISAVGVDHDDFVAVVEEAFGAFKTEEPTPQLPSQMYKGGVHIADAQADEHARFVLAFNGPAANDVKNLVTAVVTKTLLGGGASFSAGGPGKGMHSRLYRNVLARNGAVLECNSFVSAYRETGMFGVSTTALAAHAREAFDLVRAELQALATALPEEEVVRARNLTKTSTLFFTEIADDLAEDQARNLLTFGEPFSVERVVADIDKVTTADVQKFAADMLKLPHTYVAMGALDALPRSL
jgi:processing peptidase subunit alpha